MLIKYWNWVERGAIGLLATIALAIAGYAIVVRYFFPHLPSSWTSEVVIYLVVWAMLIAGSLLVAEDGHVRADVVLRLIPASYQRPIELANIVAALLFCGMMAYLGYQATVDAYQMDERSITSLQFPMWIYYASLPVGFGLMTLRYARRLYLFAFDYLPQQMLVASGRES